MAAMLRPRREAVRSENGARAVCLLRSSKHVQHCRAARRAQVRRSGVEGRARQCVLWEIKGGCQGRALRPTGHTCLCSHRPVWPGGCTRGTRWGRRWDSQQGQGAHVSPSVSSLGTGSSAQAWFSRGLCSQAGPRAATPTHRGLPCLDRLLMCRPHRSSDIPGRRHGSNLADRGRGSDPPRHRHGGAARAGGR